MWPDIGTERWRVLWKRYPQAEFVVGPAGFRQGFTDWARVINDEGTQVTGLFARDPDSFRNLDSASLRPNITIALSHDPALYLRNSEWLLAHRSAVSEEYDLAAFRDDQETNLGRLATWRLLNSILPGRVYGPIVRKWAATVRSRKLRLARQIGGDMVPLQQNDVSRQRFEVFVETIRAARAIHTDRLHVLLLSAILGKKIFAYPTTHGKLEGVYQHSLASWADVTLVRM
jgi:exopolysaccharide biosynthesis predicted pyruvyltransferase EpsI